MERKVHSGEILKECSWNRLIMQDKTRRNKMMNESMWQTVQRGLPKQFGHIERIMRMKSPKKIKNNEKMNGSKGKEE